MAAACSDALEGARLDGPPPTGLPSSSADDANNTDNTIGTNNTDGTDDMDNRKALVGGVWIVALLGMLFGSGWIAGVAHAIFWLMGLAHVVEFVAMRKVFEKADGSTGHHFVQTMLFGMFHWQPLKETQEAGGDA